MSLIFYFLLRRIFIRIVFSDNAVFIEKGIFIKRSSVIPIASIIKVKIKRGIVVRVFNASEIQLFTLNGSVTFYLKKNERLPFLPESFSISITPRFRDIIFGAFIDTRALGGILIFTAVLRRIGKLFGGEYLKRIIAAISDTAERLNNIFSFLNVAIPRIAALIVVFTFGAWTFAFLKKLMALSRFRVSRSRGVVHVQSGLITLYDNYLMINSAVSCNTLTTLLFQRAPIYSRDVMICPCVKRVKLVKTLKALYGLDYPEGKLIRSPKSALFSHCASPISWSGVFMLLLILVYWLFPPRYAMLIKTLLYGGFFASLYSVGVYSYYMKYSGVSVDEKTSLFAFRKDMRLYYFISSNDTMVNVTVSQNPFQRNSGLCNIKTVTLNHEHLNLRQLPISISKLFHFRSI